MVYPAEHMLTVFGGPLFTNEQWTVGIRSTPNFGDANEISQSVVDEIAETIRLWWVDQTIITRGAQLGFVKHNRIGPDGRYKNNITGLVEFATPVNGGGALTAGPSQVAIVASLETGVARGLANRGRIFLPAPQASVAADGRISSGVATTVATTVATLLTTLNGLVGYGTASVYSNVREGATRPITEVRVGRVLDTMRSRRAQLAEECPAAVTVGGT